MFQDRAETDLPGAEQDVPDGMDQFVDGDDHGQRNDQPVEELFQQGNPVHVPYGDPVSKG